MFFGRFIALLRIFAGPLAGALKMPYPHFLAANASGGLLWAGGTTAGVYYAGLAAERWVASQPLALTAPGGSRRKASGCSGARLVT